jgi:hypothetical protein
MKYSDHYWTLIGRGATREQAKRDWEVWQRTFYVVEDCM